MSLTNSSLWFSSGAGGGSFYPTLINDSLRWPTSGYQLFRTVGTPTDAKKHTHAFWVKVNPGTTQTLNSVYANASGYYSNSGINSDGRIIFGADYARYYYSTMKLRDPTSWVHILQVLDSTEASNSDRMKLYVNGVRQTSFTNFATVPLNWTGSYHATNGYGLRIGRTYTGAGFNSSLLSYTSEYIFVDGQALDPTDFGQFQDGIWIPDTYAGTYGNNGYKLDFSNPSNIGADSSGNGNNFSVTGLATHDVMPDTPTNNWCTYNPLMRRQDVSTLPTFSEGNLKAVYPNAGGNVTYGCGTVPITSGKWYYETKIDSLSTNNVVVGWATEDEINNVGSSHVMIYSATGAIYIDGSLQSTEGALSVGDIIGTTIDLDNGYVGFYKNGVALSFSPSISITSANWWNSGGLKEFLFAWSRGSTSDGTSVNFGQDSTFAGAISAGGNTDANGVGDFKYSVPSGYLALCTSNLPEPTIVDGSENFVPYLYTADNTSPKSRTGLGFSPDFLWFKDRTTSFSHALYDTIRGPNKGLQTNTTNAENTYTLLPSFGADGFTTQTDGTAGNILNYSTDSYVTWAWKAGGAAVSNTDGSITSQVSANVDAGFSIVSWTGAGGTSTVGHGLGVVPGMMIVKNRDDGTRSWIVYHKNVSSAPETDFLRLETTNAVADYPVWGDTAPTSSVFTVGDASTNGSGNGIIAYCFADVDGFSKAGSYKGNGSTDGTFVYTGFRPAWILIRLYDNGGTNWLIYDHKRDPYNVTDEALLPNSSGGAGGSANALDIVSNGFKFRSSAGSLNANNYNYVYFAFAETPFKYANAR